MKIKEIISFLEAKFPLSLQEDYDNSGLQIGDTLSELKGILVALDCTEQIVSEAISHQCNMIITHHPLLFKGIKRIGMGTEIERIIHRCIQAGITLYAIHTNLDNHHEGVNKRICDKLGIRNPEILSPKTNHLFKLSIYTPTESIDAVHQSVCKAGAGNIGNYSECSFQMEGKGTFTPNEKANPTIGTVNQASEVSEVKMEYLVEGFSLAHVLIAMKQAHPYEEVAHEIIQIKNAHAGIGSGMIGELSSEMDEKAFLEHLKMCFHLKAVRHTPFRNKNVRRVAVCGGAGSFLLQDAIRKNADVFVSSDFKYHEFFGAEGRTLIADIGHFESEQFTSELLVELISEKFPTFAVRLTENNTNPINFL